MNNFIASLSCATSEAHSHQNTYTVKFSFDWDNGFFSGICNQAEPMQSGGKASMYTLSVVVIKTIFTISLFKIV